MAIKLTECPDVHVETISISARELITPAGQNMGIFPKYFAECEAIEIITERITNKDAGATIEGTEAIVRNVIKEAISSEIFEAVN